MPDDTDREPGGEPAADYGYDLVHEATPSTSGPHEEGPHEAPHVTDAPTDLSGDYSYDLAHDVPRSH